MRNPTDAFKFATLASSSYSSFFQTSENPTIHRMGVFMNKYNVNTTQIGVEKIEKG